MLISKALRRRLYSTPRQILFCGRILGTYYLKKRKPKKPVFILCEKRTGSSLLVTYLNSNPGAWLHGEIFHDRRLSFLEKRLVSKKTFFHYIRWCLNYCPKPVCGVKLFFSHLSQRHMLLSDFVREFPEARWIILYRKSIFDQYVSLQTAIQTRQWYQLRWASPTSREGLRIELDPEKLMQYARYVKKNYEQALRIHALREKSLWISYEELTDNSQKLFEEAICPFLDLDKNQVHTELVRQRTKPASEIVSNYDVLRPLLDHPDLTQSYSRSARDIAVTDPSKIQIKKLEESDFDSLLNDLNPWDFKKKGRAYLEWIHRSKPHHRVSWIALLNGKVIGYYGTLTVPLKIKGEVVNAYRGGVFIHPDHRKKRHNLLNLLVRRVHEEVKKRKGVVYGFPVLKLVKYYERRIRCASIKPIRHYVLTFPRGFFWALLQHLCQPIRNPRLRKTKTCLSQITVRMIQRFDEGFDLLWDKMSWARPILSSRNSEYLNWRYLEEPGQRYTIFAAERNCEILGYVILKTPESSQEKKGRIIDLFDVRTPDVTKILLEKAILYLKKNDVHEIEAYISDDYYEKILKSLNFFQLKVRPEEAEFLVAKHYCPTVPDGLFYNPDHWFLTTADMMFA